MEIFPSNYSFENELKDNGLGILIRGSFDLKISKEISTVLDQDLLFLN